jgi:hypothetical protein
LPDQAFFVYGDRSSIAKAAGHSRVRWAGRFAPEHKIPEVLRDQLAAAENKTAVRGVVSEIEKTSGEAAIFDVAVFSRANLRNAAAEVQSISGGQVKSITRLPNNFFNVIRVEMPTGNVEQIAGIPAVVRIDAWSKPTKEDERAAHILAGNFTSATTIAPPGYNPLAQFGVNGQGVTVSVVDDGVSILGNGGFYLTPANTVDGPLRGASTGATGGHSAF